MSEERDPLLAERETTHGSFADNAKISQQIKSVMRSAGYLNFHPVYIEALDMVALKLARILSGQPDIKEHWLDLGGYAKLGEERASK